MPVLTSSKSGPWEICIQVYIRYTCLNHDGIFIPEEIHVLFKAGSLPHSFSGRTPEVRSVWHIVSLSNTLDENSNAEVPVAPVDVEAATLPGEEFPMMERSPVSPRTPLPPSITPSPLTSLYIISPACQLEPSALWSTFARWASISAWVRAIPMVS